MGIGPEQLGSQASRLLEYLPGVLQEDLDGNPSTFLGRFLLGFEKILLGRRKPGDPQEPAEPGLEEIIARLYRYFETGGLGDVAPEESAPSDFLPWLAGWLALTLRADLSEDRQRYLIANACRLYQMRGTKQGVEEFVSRYLGTGMQIDEQNAAFQINVHSTVGVDTYLSGGAPFYFHARVTGVSADPQKRKETHDVATAILDLQKPAHTFYTLDVETPGFQINKHSTVGVDTLLAPPPQNP